MCSDGGLGEGLGIREGREGVGGKGSDEEVGRAGWERERGRQEGGKRVGWGGKGG